MLALFASSSTAARFALWSSASFFSRSAKAAILVAVMPVTSSLLVEGACSASLARRRHSELFACDYQRMIDRENDAAVEPPADQRPSLQRSSANRPDLVRDDCRQNAPVGVSGVRVAR